VDASGKGGADVEIRLRTEVGGEKPFADGEESILAGKTSAVDAGNEGKGEIAPWTALEIAEDKTPAAEFPGLSQNPLHLFLGQVMEKVIGEEIIKGSEGFEFEGVAFHDGESGYVAVVFPGIADDAGVGIECGDTQLESTLLGLF
jgi:hypothetical protein